METSGVGSTAVVSAGSAGGVWLPALGKFVFRLLGTKKDFEAAPCLQGIFLMDLYFACPAAAPWLELPSLEPGVLTSLTFCAGVMMAAAAAQLSNNNLLNLEHNFFAILTLSFT